MFDTLYNKGAPYWTVLGIRFSAYGLAWHYAGAKANLTGNPVHILQYEAANPSGYILYTVKPEGWAERDTWTLEQK